MLQPRQSRRGPESGRTTWWRRKVDNRVAKEWNAKQMLARIKKWFGVAILAAV
jgi:hypothetical protein